MGANLGTLTLDLVARTGNFVGPMERAERAAAKQARAVEAAQRQAARAVESTLQELNQQVAMLGMTAGEQRLYRLETQGATRAQIEQARAALATIDAFESQRMASLASARAMNTAGLTAGQYQQAIRMLPMQLTDVAVSLASGMPLWMVAIQQGGQIRDSFGGMGNAARAVVAQIGPMNIALGGAAAVMATLAVAFQQGEDEHAEYAKALIQTGNSAGTSADAMALMAQRIGDISGTQHNAAAVLAEIATTGKFAGDQIEGIGLAAIEMERVTGKAVSDTVKEFVSLAESPGDAIRKLDGQYNFLTASVYEQIRSLEEQGKKIEAQRLAIDAYSSTMQSRAGEIKRNLGTLESAWQSLGDIAKKAWNAMLDVGREDPLEEQLANVEKRIRNASSRTGRQASRTDMSALEQERTMLQLAIQQRDAEAQWAAETDRRNKAAIAGIDLINKESKSAQGEVEGLRDRLKELEKARAAAMEANAWTPELQAGFDASVADINKQIAEAGKESNKEAEAAAKAIRSQIEALELQAKTVSMSAKDQEIYKLQANGATEADLKRASAALDTVTAFEKQKEAQEAYKKLIADLRTDEEKPTDQMRERLKVLDAMQGLEPTERTQVAARIAGASTAEAPKFEGLAPEVGGAFGELLKVDKAEEKLAEWYATQLEMLEKFREERADLTAIWDAEELAVKQQHEDALAQIEQARQLAQLSAGAEFFGNMSGAAKAFFGEQSALYKAAFITEKAFAMAKILLNAPSSYSKAFDAVVGIPIIGPALAPAAGAAAIAAQMAQAAALNNVNFAGAFDKGGTIGSGQWGIVGEYGPEIVEGPARVTGRKNTAAMLDRTIQDVQRNRQASSPTINIIEDARKAGQTQQRRGPDGEEMIDVFISNLMEDGRVHKAMQRKYGLRGVGR